MLFAAQGDPTGYESIGVLTSFLLCWQHFGFSSDYLAIQYMYSGTTISDQHGIINELVFMNFKCVFVEYATWHGMWN